jgi:hypothetical protein
MSTKYAISTARIIGPRGRKNLTPSGEPVLYVTAPFDDNGVASARAAIKQLAHDRHGIHAPDSHFALLATYTVKPGVSANYSKIFVFEYVAERELRKAFSVSDTCLDHLAQHNSYYVDKVTA